MDTPEERALTADVFEALDLSPEQFLTDGGLVNRGKLRAALWYPHDYLPEGHWMRAADEGRLRAENARLAREAHTWWTAARDAAKAERARCALRVALHSQYPIETDYDRGYDKARKDAAETLRTMGDDAGLELGPNVANNRPAVAGPVERSVGRLEPERDQEGPRGTYGCACAHHDGSMCAWIRYGGDGPEDPCECLCHGWQEDDDYS